MRRIPCSVVALFLLVSWAVLAQKAPPKQHVDKSEDEIIATVVRYAALLRKQIIFLSVNGHDPSPATLRLLSEGSPRILPVSRAIVAVPKEEGVWKDRRAGELGSYFEVEAVKRINDSRVAVSAGWGQACGTYMVIFRNGTWSIENYKAWDSCF
jgi:hypothetical protein